MKSKRRHQTSSEESELSDGSEQSSSSSASDSEDSSVSDHRYKKKRKRVDSSDSDSDSDDQKRSKKRKHKKKKKKHGKKKKRASSEGVGDSADELSSVSEGEISPKKKRKHKHKHSKRARSSSGSDIEEVRVERRLHSVVKECRATSEEGSRPPRTYYQKEYRHSQSGEEYEREREVQRFYRGSSKERRPQYDQQYQYGRERDERYGSYHQEKYEPKNREKYGQSSQYHDSNDDYNRRQQQFEGYKRQQRYEDHRTQENYHRKQREENNHHPRGEDTRGYNRYNQYEDRAPKRREYEESRDYRERRGQPDQERYQQREYPDKRDQYREERYSTERPREIQVRRDRQPRSEKPHHPQEVERSRSRSPSSRYREKSRPEAREQRGSSCRSRDAGRERARDPPAPDPETKPRERKSRFANAEDNKEYSWGKTDATKEDDKNAGDKEKPNFGLSGKLTADQNTVNGVVIKYTQPEDAKQPKRRWRFYPFKGDKALPILYIHRQSAFLLGRDKKVADIPLEHPSVSKQHAALQYRATPFTRADGSQGRRVRPYIIDLDSANGTFVNNKKVEPRRYVELLERDVVKFGFSQREYVLLHENSKDDAQDDDHHDPPELGDAVTTTEQIKREKRVKAELAEDGE